MRSGRWGVWNVFRCGWVYRRTSSFVGGYQTAGDPGDGEALLRLVGNYGENRLCRGWLAVISTGHNARLKFIGEHTGEGRI